MWVIAIRILPQLIEACCLECSPGYHVSDVREVEVCLMVDVGHRLEASWWCVQLNDIPGTY